ncbi:hypothetical protein JCM1840_000136 [Sporobolomyces johnsonii]
MAALAREGKVKLRGKKVRIGMGMMAEEKTAYLNASSIFGTFEVLGHLVSRLHARDQPIPLFLLTKEALDAAANPSADIFKKISNLNVPLNTSLNAMLRTGNLHKTLKWFIELWCLESEDGTLEEAEQKALDNARRAWLGHLRVVDALLEGARDEFEEWVALAYDMEMRAAAHKLKNHLVSFRLRNWVEDFALIFERALGCSWADTNTTVDGCLDCLGLPRRKQKDRPINPDDPTFPLIGFVWCTRTKTVCLLEKKRIKFLARLQPLLNRSMRIQLVPFEQTLYFLSKHPSSAKTKTHTDDKYKGMYGELCWWQELLAGASSPDGFVYSIGCRLQPSLPDLDAELLSDTSDVGIGILVNGAWAQFSLRPGWMGVGGRNIDFAEALGVELAVVALLSLPTGEQVSGFNVVTYCDNLSVVDG